MSKIGLGDDWLEVVRSKVHSCQVLMAVIGESWLSMDDGHGKRRLDDAEDPVRIEIAATLGKDIRVIPILLDRAEMPKAAQLPANIRKRSPCTAHEMRHKSFDRDVDALIEALDGSADSEREVGTETTGNFWSQLGKNLSESLGKRLGDAIGDKLATPAGALSFLLAAAICAARRTRLYSARSTAAAESRGAVGLELRHRLHDPAIRQHDRHSSPRRLRKNHDARAGTIMGNVVEIAYTAYMPPFPTQGPARLEISSDGRRLRGQTVNFQTRMTNYIELFR